MIASSYNEYMLMDALNLSANELLQLKLFSDLFKGSDDENKKLYRHLLKKWHPDMNTTDTSNVFVHITQLYDSLSIAVSPKSVEINGKEYPYMYSVSKDLYDIYYTDNGRGFLINFKKKNSEIKQNFLANTNSIQTLLRGHKFESRYQDLLSCKLYENKEFAKVFLPEGYVPLNLLTKYIVDFKDWKISAYIISRLYDTALMYKAANLSCIGFDLDFIFVDTKKHQIVDLSALFFSNMIDHNLTLALSPQQASSFVKSDLDKRVCSEKSINNMILSTGLILAGDLNRCGNIKMLDDSANKDMVSVIAGIDISKPIRENYEQWQTKSVKRLFNERSFYKKEIVMSDLVKYIGS